MIPVLRIKDEYSDTETARRLKTLFAETENEDAPISLQLDENGLSLCADDCILHADFLHMLMRVRASNMPHELLAQAARIKGADHQLTAIDATAGLGEDSLILAAAGFQVKMFEKNPIIFELLYDAVQRAAQTPELGAIVSRMELFNEDSIAAMKSMPQAPDVIFLDPMFPERQKSSLVKKKLQLIQKLEIPCSNERELLMAAMTANPKKLIVKRPPKGAYLAGIKPDHSLTGKAVRFDCYVMPGNRVHKYFK
ncbi:MAG: class I SAM-dependent methyltransferase [Firmicutes bacterium]|nr:class I SAM-dependent methyltransferase [Bacillota bacterium]